MSILEYKRLVFAQRLNLIGSAFEARTQPLHNLTAFHKNGEIWLVFSLQRKDSTINKTVKL